MKKNLLTFVGAAAIALGLGACAYDPYYSGNTRTAVSVGHGYGHGYGGSSFSTSLFWSTGDSRWGYDPYARAYYDHHRRAYYDPYLYGYYPVGYRPTILVGVPHPYGYRQGWCPPPRRITNVTVVNYRNRESAYRRTNHDWARNVRYDSRRAHSTRDARTRDGDRTRDARTRDGDRTRNTNTNTNRGGRTSTTRDSAFSTQSTTGSRNQWDGRNRNTGARNTATPQSRTAWQSRNTAPQPAAAGRPAATRQARERERGATRSGLPQGAQTRGQHGLDRADRARRQAQPAPAARDRGRGRDRVDGGSRRSQPVPAPAANDRSNWQRGDRTESSTPEGRGGRGGRR